MMGGKARQALRDRVHRFNGSGPEGLIDRKAPGQAPKLRAEQEAQLAEVVEQGPIPSVHGVVRWRLKDLVGWVWEEFRVTLSEQSMSRILRHMAFRSMTVRPKAYGQDDAALAAFTKASPSYDDIVDHRRYAWNQISIGVPAGRPLRISATRSGKLF